MMIEKVSNCMITVKNKSPGPIIRSILCVFSSQDGE